MTIQEMLEITNTHFDKYTEQFSTREELINHSYMVALAGTFQGCLQDYVFEADYFEDDEIEKHREQYEILFKQENIYRTLVNTFFCFTHPERTDIWGYYEGWGGTKDVIDKIIKILEKESK